MLFKQNEKLAFYTTFKIGGPADWFVVVKTPAELEKAVKWAKKKSLPFFILGAGSNILVGDKGFRGLVIKNQSGSIAIKGSQVAAGSGVLTSRLVKETINQSLAGLEEFFGLPGTIGGAVAVNAHWQHKKIKDLVAKIKRFDEVVLEIVFRLEKSDKQALWQKARAALQYRQQTQPLEYPSAGCIFQNPSVRQPAGYLIDQCGLKGTKRGGAMISRRHANFIVNPDQADAKDVLKLIALVKKKVKERFKIKLKLEIIKVGEF